MRELGREQGEILLLADDPVALIDVPALAQANGWAVDVQELDGHAVFHLTRTGDAIGH